MKIKLSVIHVIANCRDCAWECADYLTAQSLAAKHAKKNRHTVSVEVGRAGTYDGKVKP